MGGTVTTSSTTLSTATFTVNQGPTLALAKSGEGISGSLPPDLGKSRGLGAGAGHRIGLFFNQLKGDAAVIAVR